MHDDDDGEMEELVDGGLASTLRVSKAQRMLVKGDKHIMLN